MCGQTLRQGAAQGIALLRGFAPASVRAEVEREHRPFPTGCPREIVRNVFPQMSAVPSRACGWFQCSPRRRASPVCRGSSVYYTVQRGEIQDCDTRSQKICICFALIMLSICICFARIMLAMQEHDAQSPVRQDCRKIMSLVSGRPRGSPWGRT